MADAAAEGEEAFQRVLHDNAKQADKTPKEDIP